MPKQKSSVASLNTKEYDAMIAVIVEARKEKKVGQLKLSMLLGQDRNFIYKIECKDRRIDAVELFFIANALEIDPMDFFGRIVKGMNEESN